MRPSAFLTTLQRRTSYSTTLTKAFNLSSTSFNKLPAIPRCLPSNKRSTGLQVTHQSLRHSWRPHVRGSKSPFWSRLKHASTRRTTSSGPDNSKMLACTSSTASWDSRPTAKPAWSCAARVTPSVATSTSALATTTRKLPASTRTLASLPVAKMSRAKWPASSTH